MHSNKTCLTIVTALIASCLTAPIGSATPAAEYILVPVPGPVAPLYSGGPAVLLLTGPILCPPETCWVPPALDAVCHLENLDPQDSPPSNGNYIYTKAGDGGMWGAGYWVPDKLNKPDGSGAYDFWGLCTILQDLVNEVHCIVTGENCY